MKTPGPMKTPDPEKAPPRQSQLPSDDKSPNPGLDRLGPPENRTTEPRKTSDPHENKPVTEEQKEAAHPKVKELIAKNPGKIWTIFEPGTSNVIGYGLDRFNPKTGKQIGFEVYDVLGTKQHFHSMIPKADGHLEDSALDPIDLINIGKLGAKGVKFVGKIAFKLATKKAFRAVVKVGARNIPSRVIGLLKTVAIKFFKKRTKSISLPAWKKVTIDWLHISSRHVAGGALTKTKSVFPAYMNRKQIERAIEGAYKMSKRIGRQGEILKLSGKSHRMTIHMYLDLKTNTITTAFPVFN